LGVNYQLEVMEEIKMMRGRSLQLNRALAHGQYVRRPVVGGWGRLDLLQT